MTDAELEAQIRARDAQWVDALNEYRFPPTMGDAITDRRTLLQWLDEARSSFHEQHQNQLDLIEQRDEALAKIIDVERSLGVCSRGFDAMCKRATGAESRLAEANVEIERLRKLAVRA